MRFQTIFKYKKNIMAAAILMVLVYHCKGAWPESVFKRIASWFYGGVDLFFFLSGVGCWFSWQRGRDPAAFLRRRAVRILPAYLPFILVWLLTLGRAEGLNLPAVLANLCGVQGFTGVKPGFNWYVSGMWLSYLLTPWLAALAARCESRRQAALAVLALLTLSAAFWDDMELIIMVTRLPVFFVGMLFAAESGRRESLTKGETALLLALVPVGLLGILLGQRFFPDQCWSRGLAWYPMLLIVPGLCVLLAAVSEFLSRFAPGRAVNRALAFLGGFTFEIYLTHLLALELPHIWFLPLTAALTAALWALARLLRRLLPA